MYTSVYTLTVYISIDVNIAFDPLHLISAYPEIRLVGCKYILNCPAMTHDDG